MMRKSAQPLKAAKITIRKKQMPGPEDQIGRRRQPQALEASDAGQPFLLHMPDEPAGPLVLSSPHSGRNYTPEFRAASRLDPQSLRLSEDSFVDELFATAPTHGAALIAAAVPRAYVDVNREPLELDPRMFADKLPDEANIKSDRVAAGLGTIARVVANGLPIYDNKLVYAEEKRRIENIYQPYHAALQRLLRDARTRCGHAILIDCHSMPSGQFGPSGPWGGNTPACSPLPSFGNSRLPDPDIVLGDRFGTSCSPRLTDHIEALLGDMGYSVVRNNPYAGGYCTVRYGAPRKGVHAIQIEINRRLYMDERRIKRGKKAMQRVAADMDHLIATVSTMKASALDLGATDRLAAE